MTFTIEKSSMLDPDYIWCMYLRYIKGFENMEQPSSSPTRMFKTFSIERTFTTRRSFMAPYRVSEVQQVEAPKTPLIMATSFIN